MDIIQKIIDWSNKTSLNKLVVYFMVIAILLVIFFFILTIFRRLTRRRHHLYYFPQISDYLESIRCWWDFDINEELKKLMKGYMDFQCPSEMKINEILKVKAIIANKKDLLEDILEVSSIEEIMTSELMKLTLKGDNFIINNYNSDAQFITNDSATEWVWSIKPTMSGIQSLTLLVSIQFQTPKSGKGFKDFHIYEKKVKVKVNPIYSVSFFLKDNWKWIMGLLAGSGLIWKIIDLIKK